MKNVNFLPEMARMGYSVIPVDNKKKALTPWKSKQEEVNRPEIIQSLLDEGHQNFALICGVNGLEVIDIDTKNLVNPALAERFFLELLEKIPENLRKRVVIERTPSRGYHLLYRCQEIEPNQHLAKNSEGKPIIETRGIGRYAVCYPSPGYNLEQNEFPEIPEIKVDERALLFDACRSMNMQKQRGTNQRNEGKKRRRSKGDFGSLIDSVISQIEESGVDITSSYDNWVRIGFALANTFGDEGRDYFHRVSRFYPTYDHDDCNQKYSDLLASTQNNSEDRQVTIATFFEICREQGVEVVTSDPRVVEKYRMVTQFLHDRHICFNLFNRKTEIGDDEIEDRHVNSLYADLQQLEVSASKNYISTLIHSDRTLSYHPLQQYGDEISEVEAGDEIQQFFDSLVLQETDSRNVQLLRTLVEKWLLQFPAVIYDEIPPRLVLVLIGPSHLGKTYLFRHLLPGRLQSYYAESALNQGKDSFILMAERLLINNDEFGGIMRMNEMEQFKRMASAETFDERRAYGRYNERFRRRAILCGTSNRVEVIMDHTAGNTRIIPVEISGINQSLFNDIDKEKLFASILSNYRELGPNSTRLSFDESDALQEYSRGFQTPNFEAEAILTMYERGDIFIPSVDLVGRIRMEYGAQINMKRIPEEFRRLGFQAGRRHMEGRHLRGFLVRPLPRGDFGN